MKLLVDMLSDWLRYEIKNGKRFGSEVWINIEINAEGLNKAVSKRIGKDVDAYSYVHFCDDSFFQDKQHVYWWKKFPAGSLIVIDEVHKYLGKKVEYGSLDLETECVNWLSTHRHDQQEIWLITQHTDQSANMILGVADRLFEITNMKSYRCFGVPMSDVYEVGKSFGFKTQYYQANSGSFRGKALRFDGVSERFLMSSEIFGVYKSHGGDATSDRPELQMTWWEGSCWFTRRHAWHLLPKLSVVPIVLFWGVPFLLDLPKHLMAGVAPQNKVVKQEDEDHKVRLKEKSHDGEKAGDEGLAGGVPVAAGSGSRLVASRAQVAGESDDVAGAVEGFGRRGAALHSAGRTDPPPTSSLGGSFGKTPAAEGVGALGVGKKRVKIVMLFEKGVMLDDGEKAIRWSIGEVLDYDGVQETLACVNVDCGIVGFESGKRVQVF